MIQTFQFFLNKENKRKESEISDRYWSMPWLYKEIFFRKSRYFAKMGLKDMASLQARLSKDLVSFQYRLSLMTEAVVYLFSTIAHSHCLKLWQLCKVNRTLQFKRFLMLIFVLRESNLNPLLILINYSLFYSFPRLWFYEANKYIFIGLTLCLQDYDSRYFQGLHSWQGRRHSICL